MPGKAVGRAAVDLPWLCPNTDSLVRLAENPASLSASASSDPALFTFLCRFALGEAGSPFTPTNDRLLSSSLPEVAAAYLGASRAGWLNPDSSAVQWVNAVANRAAAIARTLAESTKRVHAEAAKTAARLAPLGWYAVLAVDEAEAEACFHEPELQESRWDLDHDSITRRLAARWRLPEWLATVVGCLNISFDSAVQLGADPDLFAIVCLAVNEAEHLVADLGLSRRCERSQLLTHLEIDAVPVVDVMEEAAVPATSLNPNPHETPLIANLLRTATMARRRSGAALVLRLEERIDELHRTAESLADQAGTKLQNAKIIALAEFAAGAGHEINNPLTAISGHAQRLIRTEQDDDRADSLRAIVRQTHRISGILRELMQFARPPKVEAESLLVLNLASAVYHELLPLAEERGVRLELVNAAADVRLRADPKQVKAALGAIVRNGIEAAGTGGWVRLGCSRRVTSIQFAIEDSGEGLTQRDAEHAFDPFYSGRSAGRGRGLGLPTAWQLARRNGGELRYEPDADGLTRFILTLPVASNEAALADRRSA